MSTWYKVKWIDPLFAAFNTAFPQRTKGSDGTIGDTAHQGETSGHNPDDTPGVRAERSDSDTRPEVRAADVTSDLRRADGGRTPMIDVVGAILATPADRNRLIYIICDGKIWRSANGWRQEIYTGTDRHYGHAHFSGDPASDENGAPWNSVLRFSIQGVTMASVLTSNEQRQLTNVDEYGYGVAQELDPLPNIHGGNGALVAVPNLPAQRAKRIELGVNALLARPVAGGMTPEEREAQAEDIANRVLAVLATKIGDVITQALAGPEVRAAAVEDARQGANLAEDS